MGEAGSDRDLKNSEFDIHQGTTAEGKKVNVVVSQNTMVIYTKDEIEGTGRRNSLFKTEAEEVKIKKEIDNTFLEKVREHQ
jgi:hypothetical protein